MREFADVRIAYGTSDEYSFVLHHSSGLYGRRSSKIVSVVASCFAANYVRWWGNLMGGTPLRTTPVFDGRAVCYPDAATLRDYLSWRQADCHINNQARRQGRFCTRGAGEASLGARLCSEAASARGDPYNTPYWELVKSGLKPPDAQAALSGSDAGFKNELLFSRFGINYNELPEQFRKGSVVVRRRERVVVKHRDDGTPVERERPGLAVLHCDIIGERFWQEHPDIL
ncbi:tRNA(His) guanylyltransferase [Monoraphidium neglectum]|uniref:tRNA(His) guanylyltransferase n=1 Tax=Monoraphidium neglectum TaxID=145388 RepID=A0A0D2MAW2_9CHLO|nr:tRNA(His) guanylyltransferase [Monoraphidium neglectum]KIZ00415.1 tRNA(His) guanylyltransferase [Monoraphidium neglectum]|eukprot:XP_013899434.1 tRNA(His) guanylyltransferase [Monoraphidium neglectum]